MRLVLKSDLAEWLKITLESYLTKEPWENVQLYTAAKLNARYIVDKITQFQQGKKTVMTATIRYDCAAGHNIKGNSWHREIYCEICDKWYSKAECKRFRVYNSSGKRKEMQNKKRPYSHDYYMKRKMGLCKKQRNPWKPKQREQ